MSTNRDSPTEIANISDREMLIWLEAQTNVSTAHYHAIVKRVNQMKMFYEEGCRSLLRLRSTSKSAASERPYHSQMSAKPQKAEGKPKTPGAHHRVKGK
ncbi:MAG TPA: hypothetical protein VI913_02610 [Candidatus Peribacteraceae bacterium]|nr:hypothetical protein [Candidatus Peribacteraceae bacterium]